MTRGELLAAVKMMARRPRLSDDDLGTMLNLAEGEMSRVLRDHPRNIVTATLTVEADEISGEYSNRLPLPTTLARIVSLKQGDTLYEQYPPYGSAPRVGYIERGNCLELYPTPSTDTEYLLVYHSFLIPLINSWDTNWVSTWFPDLYIYGTLRELGVSINHPRRQEWAEEFKTRAGAVNLQGWDQNVSSSYKVTSYD